jgi:hypothetical protein
MKIRTKFAARKKEAQKIADYMNETHQIHPEYKNYKDLVHHFGVKWIVEYICK